MHRFPVLLPSPSDHPRGLIALLQTTYTSGGSGLVTLVIVFTSLLIATILPGANLVLWSTTLSNGLMAEEE